MQCNTVWRILGAGGKHRAELWTPNPHTAGFPAEALEGSETLPYTILTTTSLFTKGTYSRSCRGAMGPGLHQRNFSLVPF